MKEKRHKVRSRGPASRSRKPDTAIAPTRTVLDLGCGLRKRPGAVGIDVNPRSQADVIHNLNAVPYPFPEDCFNEIIADNVMEHLDDIVKVMEELFRIGKPSALITIIVPFFPHRQANTDPTHKHFFGIHSFDYFIPGTANAGFQYSHARFSLLSVQFEEGLKQEHWIDRIIVRFANAHREMYENRLANLFPLRNLTFRLRIEK